MSVREYVFATCAYDPTLIGLGLNVDTLYANNAPDSPKERFWGVLRWGAEVPGAPGQRGTGRVTERECSLWVYDKAFDYTAINKAIRQWVLLLDAIEGKKTGSAPGDGWITQADWQSDGDDGYDDVYEAIYRSSTYIIIASGD
jgi:hypothetical protein